MTIIFVPCNIINYSYNKTHENKRLLNIFTENKHFPKNPFLPRFKAAMLPKSQKVGRRKNGKKGRKWLVPIWKKKKKKKKKEP